MGTMLGKISDRSIQVALLVILVAIITAAAVAVARSTVQVSTPIAVMLAGMATTAMAGITVLISRPSNTVGPPAVPAPPDPPAG
jgi:putative Mn2+ efflux pump MntP